MAKIRDVLRTLRDHELIYRGCYKEDLAKMVVAKRRLLRSQNTPSSKSDRVLNALLKMSTNITKVKNIENNNTKFKTIPVKKNLRILGFPSA